MKKFLCLFLIGLVIVTGCSKKGNDDSNNASLEGGTIPTEVTTTSTTSVTQEDETTKKTTTKKKTTEKLDDKTTTTTTKKTTSCTKVFKNKYSVVTKDKTTCMKEGNIKFMDLSDAGVDIFAYGCEEIKDNCGDTYYGAFYWRYDHDKSTEVKVYR